MAWRTSWWCQYVHLSVVNKAVNYVNTWAWEAAALASEFWLRRFTSTSDNTVNSINQSINQWKHICTKRHTSPENHKRAFYVLFVNYQKNSRTEESSSYWQYRLMLKINLTQSVFLQAVIYLSPAIPFVIALLQDRAGSDSEEVGRVPPAVCCIELPVSWSVVNCRIWKRFSCLSWQPTTPTSPERYLSAGQSAGKLLCRWSAWTSSDGIWQWRHSMCAAGQWTVTSDTEQ